MKRTLATLLLAACSLLTAGAATITGTVTDINGTPYTATCVFYPLSNPQLNGGVVYTRKPKSLVATNGVFSVVLAQGDYRVLIDGQNQLLISVPTDAGAYSLSAVTVSNTTYSYTMPPASSSTLASLRDVLTGTGADNDVLMWDAALSRWKNQPFPGLITEDGVVTTPADFWAKNRTNAETALSAVRSNVWTMAYMSDPQNLTNTTRAEQAVYLITNKDALALKMVMTPGDIVDLYESPAQWANSTNFFYTIRGAGIPVLVTPGNHDYPGGDPDPLTPVNTEYSSRYGLPFYSGQSWYNGGMYETNGLNVWITQRIAGRDWLFMSLEWGPRDAVMAWAWNIWTNHPNHSIILSTHVYLDPEGTRDGEVARGPAYFYGVHTSPSYVTGRNNAQQMWDGWLRKLPNLVMVLCGHNLYRIDSVGGEYSHYERQYSPGRAVSWADDGHPVHEIMANYQGFASDSDILTNGWFRLLTFDGDRCHVSTYSTSYGTNRLGDLHDFTLDLAEAPKIGGAKSRVGLTQYTRDVGLSSHDLAEGLWFYAPLNELWGTNAVNVVTGTRGVFGARPTHAITCALTTNGISGGALQFSDWNYVNFGNEKEPWLSSLSGSIWYKGAGSSTFSGTFISRHNGSTDSEFLFSVAGDPTTNILNVTLTTVALTYPNALQWGLPTTLIASDGFWHHYGFVYNGTNVTAYFDGVSLGAKAAPAGGPWLNTSDRNLYIGDYQGGAGGSEYTLNGIIDEVRLWSRPLSEEDMWRLAHEFGRGGAGNAGEVQYRDVSSRKMAADPLFKYDPTTYTLSVMTNRAYAYYATGGIGGLILSQPAISTYSPSIRFQQGGNDYWILLSGDGSAGGSGTFNLRRYHAGTLVAEQALAIDTNGNMTLKGDFSATNTVRGRAGVFSNSITLNGDTITAWPTGTGGGATNAYSIVQDEGTPLTPTNTINFIGSGITASDGVGRTDVTLAAPLNALATDPNIYQHTNSNLTLLQAFGPTTWQSTNAILTALAGVTSGTDRLPYFTGVGTADVAEFSAAARDLLNDATSATMRFTLGLQIGADVQAYNTNLLRLASIGPGSSGDLYYRDATGWTNLAKSTDGKVLKLAAGLPAWGTDETSAGGESAGTVHAPDGATTANSVAIFKDATGTNISGTNSLNLATTYIGTLVVTGAVDGLKLTNTTYVQIGPTTNVVGELAKKPNIADQLYQQTNAALTALAADPNLFQHTNANLTLWQAIAPSAKQDADTDLTTWAGITPGTGVGTFLATPSSANLASAVTGETGSGALVFGTAPEISTIELGHASDTTLSRSGAGDVQIEGNAIYRAGGTDVPVTDGGTGRSTGTTAYALVATGTTATGAQQTLASGATTEVLVGGGASALPVWTTATGTGAPVRAGGPTLTGDPLAPTPAASDNDTSIATTAFVTGSTVAFTGKTFDAAATGNVLKQTRHMFLMRPDYGDGVGAIPQTNNYTVSGLMHYTFSGTAETNANWVVYGILVPADIDTAVAMTATIGFVSGGTDTDTVTFHLTYALGVSGTAVPEGTAIATSPIVVTTTPVTPAAGDVQHSAATTLTGWAASMTPGTQFYIRLARLNDSNDDAQRERFLDIAYGSTQ